MAQGTLGGSNDTDSLAVDGTKCGIDVAAITSVQLGQAACIGNSLGSALGIILDQVERSSGSFEIKHSGASQVVGRQHTHNAGSGGSCLDGIFFHDSGNACLGGKLSRAGSLDLVLCIERSSQEQLSVSCHDADISCGGLHSAGAGAGTGNNGNLRHNAGDAGDLSGQAGVCVQQLQAAFQLSAGRIVERYNGIAGLSGHFQHASGFIQICRANGFPVLVNGINALAIGTAERCADGTVSKQRRIVPLIKKCCKDCFLAWLISCHTLTSCLFNEQDGYHMPYGFIILLRRKADKWKAPKSFAFCLIFQLFSARFAQNYDKAAPCGAVCLHRML